jgi:hypothetical protein
MSDKRFSEGIYWKDKHENAPDFVIGSISVNAEKFVAWISGEEPDEKGCIRLKVLRSREGKPYIEVDDWKPGAKYEKKEVKEEIPIIGPDGEEVPF